MDEFPVEEKKLDNGLKVLVWEDKTATCASVWLVFRVGSGHERPGLTGVSHWVEHMLFQGGIEFDKGEIFKAIARVGGYNNGFTSKHITAYFETLPAEHVDLGMRIEADRGLHSKFDPEETERERTVIISERQGGENSPERLLDEEVDLAAIRAHPYRWSVIGHMSDLKTMTRDDLYGYYQTNYTAENSTLVVTGKVDPARIFERAAELFGGMQTGGEPHRFTEEPEQHGARVIELRKPGTTHYFDLGFHAPAGTSKQAAAMIVLDSILSEAKSFGMGGGSGGRTARLYRRLVAGGLATSAWSYYSLTPEPYLLKIGATVRQDVKASKVERTLLAELAKMRDKGPSDAEVEKVKRQVAAAVAKGLDGTTNRAYLLARGESLGDWREAERLPAAIEKVTAKQVHEVARTVLADKNRTLGRFIPEGVDGSAATGAGGGGKGGGGSVMVQGFAPELPCAFYTPRVTAGGGTGSKAIPGLKREELANGIILLTAPRKGSKLVAIRSSLGIGGNSEPIEKAGLARFSAAAAQRGTEKHNYRQIFQRLDGVGASFSMYSSRHRIQFSGSSLARDGAKVIRTAGEILRTATFPANEVEKVRGEIVSGIRQDEEDTRAVSGKELRKTVFGAEHPLGHDSGGVFDSIAGIGREELAEWLSAASSPKGMIVSVCGDVSHSKVRRWVEETFGDWDAPALDEPQIAAAEPGGEVTRKSIVVPGKTQSDIALGFPGLRRHHEDYYAYSQATHILGRLGLMGRLGDRVRDQMGLAYYVYASAPADPVGDMWTIRAGVNPENVSKAVDAIEEELARMRSEEVSDAEFSDCQTNLVGSRRISLESCDQVASAMLSVEFLKLGVDFLDRHEEIVRSVSLSAIREAAEKHYPAKGYSIVVAGPESQ